MILSVTNQDRKGIKKKTMRDNVYLALSSSDIFVPVLVVCLYSLAKNASPNREYEISILQTDISSKNRDRIADILAEFPNTHLRFINVPDSLKNKDMFSMGNIPVQTYFRLLLPSLFPERDKMMYLDSDMIILRDVGQLYDEDLGDAYLLITHDADGTAQFNGSLPWMKDYGRKALHLQDQNEYFQAGVLVMNLARFRRDFSTEQMLMMADRNYIYCDQDILNRLCEGQVHYLDMRWNVMMDCGNERVRHILRYAPPILAETYQKARQDPWIIHYAGEPKPWQQEHVDFEAIFWRYAEACGEADTLRSNMRNGTGAGQAQYYTAGHHFLEKLSQRTRMSRFLVNIICPRGSTRFESLKKTYRKLQMQKKYRQNNW